MARLPVSKIDGKEGDVEMSSWQTPKTNWGQPGQTVPGADDFNRIEGNIEALGRYDRAPGYGTATGTNTKAITLSPAPSSYYEGLCFAFKNETQNTGAVTINVNGMGAKAIKKPNGNDLPAGFLKAGSIYTVRYNGSNFILQGEGGEYGTAQPEHVLQGYTIGTEQGIVVGTMPDNSGAEHLPVDAWRSWNGTSFDIIVVPKKGYYSGTYPSQCKIVEPNYRQENIRAGVDFLGAPGTFTADATASAGNILSGKTAYANGVKLTGTMPNRGSNNIQARLGSDVSIPAGYYNGSGKVLRPIFQVGTAEHKIEPYDYHDIYKQSFYRSSNYRFNYAGQVRLKLYVYDHQPSRQKWLKLYRNTTLIRHIPNPLPGELTEYIDDITVAVNDTVYYEVYNMDIDPSDFFSGLSMLLDAEPLFTKI